MAGVRCQPQAIAACGRRGPPRQAKQSRHALGGARLPLLPLRWAWLCAAAPKEAAARQGRSIRKRGTVQAEATRLYSAGLEARTPSLVPASRGS